MLPDVCVYCSPTSLIRVQGSHRQQATFVFKFSLKPGRFLHSYLKDLKVTLIKYLSHPGHGKYRRCFIENGTCFSLLKTFHPSAKRFLQC